MRKGPGIRRIDFHAYRSPSLIRRWMTEVSSFLMLAFRLARREEFFRTALSFHGIEEKVSFISLSFVPKNHLNAKVNIQIPNAELHNGDCISQLESSGRII